MLAIYPVNNMLPVKTVFLRILLSQKRKLSLLVCLLLIISLVRNSSFAQSNFAFLPSNLRGAILSNPTSMQFGPDDRLYVSQQNGIIKVFTIVRNAPNDYSVVATDSINIINTIPNHNDDGTANTSVIERQVTGILLRGTPANPLLYVTSSDSRMGGPGGDVNLDTNSGILSLLTKSGSTWQKIDLVRGLPRSEENHSPNGIQLDDQTNMLYMVIGGFTNAGAPSFNFAYISEYALAAGVLSINLNVINAMPTKGTGNNSYKYDLPTLDDPTRANNPDGSDINDPFGGNDGLNQSKIVIGGPVQVFASGFRNSYDLLITKTPGKAGRMYSIDNGGNQGWGGYPANEGQNGTVTNNYIIGEPGSTGPGMNDPVINNLDNLHYIGTLGSYTPGSYYAGHPNPIRANPAGAGLYTHNGTTGVWRTTKTGPNPLPADWPPVPLSMANPVEGDFQNPGETDNAILTFNVSVNGMAEYTASNFNNTLKGSLLATSFDGKIFRMSMTADGSNVTNSKASGNRLNKEAPIASGFGEQSLDLVAQGDNDVYAGTIWVVNYSSNNVTIFEPQDFINCTENYDNLDDDGDGYTNADEVDNGTQPCSAASKPNDADHDHISDLNDPDDDNDGISDNIDYFPLDPNNGLTTNLPIHYNLFNNDPGTGIFGVGFTGLMSNKQPSNDYIKNYDENNFIAGGAAGAISMVAASTGDALGALNNQQNAFQFGIKSEAGIGPFTVNARLLGQFFDGNTPLNYQSQGIYVGTGDQSNYFKITLNANGGAGGIEVVYENTDVPVSYQFTLAGGIPLSTLDLYLSVNPVNGTIQPRYSLNGGTIINLGSPIAVSGALLNAIQQPVGLAVGIISTSRGSTPFTATWDYIYVTTDALTSTGIWTTITPIANAPAPREEAGYVEAGNKFYLVGGKGIDSVKVYDPVNKSWANKTKPPVELNHFQAVSLDGLIYAAGAFNGVYPREVPVSQVYMYNPATDNWLAGSSIPVARRRGAGGTVVYKNKIYLVGGITDGHWTGSVNWFDEYDPATNTWKLLTNAPRVRDHFQAAVVNDKLYLIGGRRSSGSTGEFYNLTVPQVDVYDFTTSLWSTLPVASNLPTPRAGASTVVLGNEILVIGGESTQATAHVQTEALDVVTNTWRRLADLKQGRHATQAVKSNNGIYIESGAGNQGSSSLLSTQESFYMFAPTIPSGVSLTQSQLNTTSNISFGSIPIGSEITKTLTVSNTVGNTAIVVSSITVTGVNSFSYSLPFSMPFIIAPGASMDVSLKFKPTISGSQTASLVVNHSGQGGSNSVALLGDGSTPVYRINAGGGAVTNSIGAFAADGFYSPSPGNTSSTGSPINGTTDDVIYQSERYGASGTLSYSFPLTNGQYTVVLHFAEIYFTSIGNRVFDVSIEGVKVLDDYDIIKKVGALTATTESFPVNMTDGNLNIDFSSLPADGGANSPKISAIEIVRSSSNQVPIGNAGPDRTISLPVNSTSLSGSSSDADGSISSYSWTQLSGPNTVTFSNGTVAAPTISGLVAGTYVFSMVVTDNQGAPSAADQVVVTVNPAGSIPVYRIHAGGGQLTTSLGVFAQDAYFSPATSEAYSNFTGIGGTTEDALYQTERNSSDGVLRYAFPVTNGKYIVVLHFAEIYYTLASSRVFDVSIEGVKVLNNFDIVRKAGYLTATTETFPVTVNDGVLDIYFSSLAVDEGADRPKISAIEILKSVNQAPVANAGADKTITLPVSSTTLSGLGSDADGTISGYSWTQVSGPNTANFNNTTVASPVVSGLISGIYVFSLIVTDNAGAASAGDQVVITVNSASNQAPVANAGPDKAITLPVNSTTLSGSASDADGTIASYTWTQISGPNTASFSSKTVAVPTVSGMIVGTYVFSLTATDNLGISSAADQVSIIVNPALNQVPVANAGTDKTIVLPENSTTLSGSATDADGTISTYTWTQISGPNTATFNSTTAAIPTVSGLINGIYVFSLVVTDNSGAPSIEDRVNITVNSPANQAPVADAGSDKTIVFPTNSTALSGSGTDADGTISTYAWTQVSGPNTAAFTSTTVAAPTVSGLVTGVYIFSLLVTDNLGTPSATDQVIITVNTAPVADAGPDKTIVAPSASTSLSGSGTDADGSVSTYAWTQVSGPNTASFSSKTVAAVTVSGLIPGNYVFSLIVTDNLGTPSVADQVNVTVNPVTNQLPVANAGPDKIITAPASSTSLTGSGTDADGTISGYGWTQISGPNTASFSSNSLAVPTVSGLIEGIYVFSLVVTDNLGAPSAADQVTITVNSAVNQAPVANAGPDIIITAPVSNTTLNGSGADADGTISGYTWTQISGPNTAVFSSKTVAAPLVSGMSGGVYVFSLIVSDNSGALSAADQINVTVNLPPVADAGIDKTITLPITSTTLNGSGSDADGTISIYSWSQVSGPNTATFSSKTVAIPTISGLAAGVYVFSLVATDNLGASSIEDQVSVSVNSVSNQAPVANAGPDKAINLPTNNTTLSGSGTDADGTIGSYTWTQISGPNTAGFSSTTVAVPTVSGLVAGSYVFSLIVTDNLGTSSAADQVIITVNAIPIANAGADKIINLPLTTASLDGLGTDADGTVNGYSWTQVSGPNTAVFTSKTVAVPTVSGLAAGVYVFSFVVTDNLGAASLADLVTVTVNTAPSANAGPDRLIVLPVSSLDLNGSGSDADGTISTYSWSQVSGPGTASFSSKSVAVPTVSGLVSGNYVFSLIVTDNLGASSASDEVNVAVNPPSNLAPVANAGLDKIIMLPANSTSLNGSGTDADGTVSGYAWTQLSGPNTAGFTSKTIAIPTVSGLIEGTYIFSLIVTDNLGTASLADQVIITVNAPANQPPVADAGPDKTIILPVSSNTLNGSGTDADGTVMTYAWTQVSGPNTAIFTSKTEAVPTISGLVAGVYVFSLAVTDNNGATSVADQVSITVSGVTNQSPVADAGPDKAVTLPVSSTTLNGSGSDADGTISSYFWTQVSGPNTAIFTNKTVAVPTVSGLAAGVYVFSLIVTDNNGASSVEDQVSITVNAPVNELPVANAGPDKTITLPTSSTTLSGSATDADGTIATYTWTQVNGPNTAVFSSKTLAVPNVSGLLAGSYTFSLVVTDNLGAASVADQVIITVNEAANQAPVANGGPDKTITLPISSTTLSGSGSDADGIINTYIWTQLSGPNTAAFTSKTVAVPTVSALVSGSYTFSLVVTDDLGAASAADQVIITVNPAPNQLPVADAGPDKAITLPVSNTTLSGSGSDADGTISTYTWTQVSGPNIAAFTSNTVPVPTISGLVAGSYIFSLVVTDNLGAASPADQVAITVNPAANQLPIADAGPDKAITLPVSSTTLSGSGSDADGTINTYTWTQVSGPNTATFTSKNVAVPTISALVSGSYIFSLVVTDNLGATSSADQVTITVNPAPNQLPVADAGPDKAITLPVSSTTLSGSGSDADGTISTYTWTQVGGTNAATFNNKNAATPTISALVAGSYTFSLVVTDNLGAASSADQVIVTVNPAPNQLPVANAGPDKAITLPVSSTTLSGSGSDADGTISTYTWTQVSGPNTATFNSNTLAVPTISGLVAGSYTFNLVVADNLGAASAADQVIVTVSPVANQLPVANAGPDKAITLPVSSTTLNGSGSDADGTISTYAWTQVSGPNTAIITGNTIAVPTISGLVSGSYVFSLIVTDNLGAASAADQVIVTVSPATNQLPVANAGPDKAITLPVSSTTLSGSGSDADGSISTYTWTQVSGPNTATFTSKNVAVPTISGLVSGPYTFSLVVTDNLGAASAADQVIVTVNSAANQLPVANAGPDKAVTLPVSSTTLSGSGSDADGTISTYTWTQVSGPNTATFTSKAVAVPTISGLVAGSYTFSLVVTDNLGAASAADQVIITVSAANQLPIANAGPDKAITLPVSSTTLSGSGSDADGTVSTYTWTQVSGPNTATFTSKTVAVPTISALVAGSYTFSLVVTDNLGAASAADQVIITVNAATNTPVYRINAGGGAVTNSIGAFAADAFFSPSPGNASSTSSPIAGTTDDPIYQTERYGGSGTLNYAFPVTNGQYTVILHFAEIYFGAVNNRVFDVSIEGAKVLDNFDIVRKVGSFTATTESFPVNVTDGSLDIYFSSLAVDGGNNNPKVSAIEIIRTSSNVSPVSNAGPDKTITLPINSTSLSGSGTDADGTISSYSWTQASGPNTAVFNNNSIAAPTVSGLVAGIYTFNLVVTDNLGAASTADQMILTVSPAGSTPVYRINAGGGQVTNSIGVFAADQFYTPTPGNTSSSSTPIAGTTDDAIYQTERYGAAGTINYAFPVANGQYTVVLHFAEIYFAANGNRVFDVSLEGNRVLDQYDIFRKVGANTATTESFVVNVTDGVLNIYFSSLAVDGGVNSPKVSAIEIISSSGSQAAAVEHPTTDKLVAQPESLQKLPVIQKLGVKVQPNPSKNHFTLTVTSGIDKPVTIAVFNSVGRLMEIRSNVGVNKTLQIGNSYRPGMYYAEICQGKEKLILKFIKQSQ